jgi:hypothetical protein
MHNCSAHSGSKTFLLHGFAPGVALNLKNKLGSYGTIQISAYSGCDYNIFTLFERKYPISFTGNWHIKQIVDSLSGNFSRFKEFYSRHFYPKKISDKEYRIFFIYYLYFFYHLYKKQRIKFVVFSNIPHEGPDYIAYLLAKKLHIQVLVFTQSPFAGRTFFSNDMRIYGAVNHHEIAVSNTENKDDIEKVVKKAITYIGHYWYMKNVPKYIRNRFFYTLRITIRRSRKIFIYMAKIIPDCFRYSRQITLLEIKKVNLQKKYVYFPLHLQPELTTSALGFDFIDSNDILEILERLTPDDHLIYVKENPKQTPFKRPTAFFKRVSKFKKVKFVPVTFPSLDLIKHSTLVITNTGTVGWEAINLQKKVLTFGTTWYRSLPGVIQYRKGITWQHIVSCSADFQKIEVEVKELIKQKTINAVADPGYKGLVENFSEDSNNKNIADFIAFYSNLS